MTITFESLEDLQQELLTLQIERDNLQIRVNELDYVEKLKSETINKRNYTIKQQKREISELKGRITCWKTWGHDLAGYE